MLSIFGLMTKSAHDAEIETLTKARDHLVDALNEAERKNRELDGLASKFKDRADRLKIDNEALTSEMEAIKRARGSETKNGVDAIVRLQTENRELKSQIDADARYVEVGKARLAALQRQNEKAKQNRRAA